MAFGTGQHATTRACLEAIEPRWDGPGSLCARRRHRLGVLALALARLGVERVVALDTDRRGPARARDLTRNGATRVALLAGRSPRCAGRSTWWWRTCSPMPSSPRQGRSRARSGQGAARRLGLVAEQLPAVRAAYPGWRVAETRAEGAWRTSPWCGSPEVPASSCRTRGPRGLASA